MAVYFNEVTWSIYPVLAAAIEAKSTVTLGVAFSALGS